MYDFSQMLRRSHVQQLCSYFLSMTELSDFQIEEDDDRPYEQRRKEKERPIWALLEKTFADETTFDDAGTKLEEALDINRQIFLEIGIHIGARLMLDFLREEPLPVKKP